MFINQNLLMGFGGTVAAISLVYSGYWYGTRGPTIVSETSAKHNQPAWIESTKSVNPDS